MTRDEMRADAAWLLAMGAGAPAGQAGLDAIDALLAREQALTEALARVVAVHDGDGEIGVLDAQLDEALTAARESKHTPGPWEIAPFVDGDEAVNVVKDYKRVPNGASAHWIAGLDADLDFDADRETVLDEMYANARLIAAAPDLLAACKMVASFAQSWQPLSPGDIRVMLDAIAKAEGDSGGTLGTPEADPPGETGGSLGQAGE